MKISGVDKKYIDQFGEQFLIDREEVEKAYKNFETLFESFTEKYPIRNDNNPEHPWWVNGAGKVMPSID